MHKEAAVYPYREVQQFTRAAQVREMRRYFKAYVRAEGHKRERAARRIQAVVCLPGARSHRGLYLCLR